MSPENKNSPCPGIYHMPQARDGELCRIRLEQGYLTAVQLRLFAGLARTHGNGIIELTNRANIQLRGIKPQKAMDLIHALEQAGLAPKTPAGDGVRNVMVNPTAGFDIKGSPQTLSLAQRLSAILQTTPSYQTLSPKFSVLLDGGEACAIIHHISDIWLSLCDKGENFAFGLASRPPLDGEAPSALGKVPANKAQTLILTLVDLLLKIRDSQPHIERMKHLLEQFRKSRTRFYDKNCGKTQELEQFVGDLSKTKTALAVEDILALLRQRLPFIADAKNFRRAAPAPHAHLGIHSTSTPQRFYLGIKPPLGRLNPQMTNFIADNMAGINLRLTPWHSLIFPDLDEAQAQQQAQIFSKAGFITSSNAALAQIVCCSGGSGCGATKVQVRTDAVQLAQALGNKNFVPIHLTGCTKSCAASEAMATTLVAREQGIYDLFSADKQAPSPFGRLLARALTIKQVAELLTQENLAQQSAKFLPESHR